VTLRQWREDDAPAVADICQDPEIPRWTNVPSPYTEADAREFIRETLACERAEMARAIVDAHDDTLLGAIGLRLPAPGVGEVGYWLAAPARGRGAATRAVRLMCAWAFRQFSLARIQLHTLPGNDASERVAERAGFTREGVLRRAQWRLGAWHDVVLYSKLRGE
jgi:RimJ/RimL family protein N-acetyltransferase